MKINVLLSDCTFNTSYRLLVGGNSFLRKQLKQYSIEHDPSGNATTYFRTGHGVIFAFHKDFSLDLIAHEVAHARQACLSSSGFYLRTSGVTSDPWLNSALAESEAYLEGFLFAEIVKALGITWSCPV